jgi:hypothetical protein
MVIAVLADIIQIVVLSARTYALLGIDDAFVLALFASGIDRAEENRFELVHARIGEQEGRIGEGDDRRGFDWFASQYSRPGKR